MLGKGVGCLRSVFCVLVSNIDRLLAGAWCLLSALFKVSSRHRTAAFTAIHWYASSIVATRPPKLQVRSRRALWRFRHRSQNKRKVIIFTLTKRRWRSCELQNDNGSHQPCGLRRSTCRCRLAFAARHQAACMLEGQGSLYTTWAFWLAFGWCVNR